MLDINEVICIVGDAVTQSRFGYAWRVDNDAAVSGNSLVVLQNKHTSAIRRIGVHSESDAQAFAGAVARNIRELDAEAEKMVASGGGNIPITPVAGYTQQSAVTLGQVNANKRLEEQVLLLLDMLKIGSPQLDVDQRWLAVGRTHIEQGFMAINRAIFKPQRSKLPEE